MEESITIVRAEPEHASVIKRLFRQVEADSQPEHPAAQDHAAYGFDKSRSVFDFLSSDSAWLLLAMHDDLPIGYATLARLPKADSRVGVLYLDELHVLKSHRRHGVGSALLREAEMIAREINAWRLRLLVGLKNDTAQQFYKAVGFDVSEAVFCQKEL